MASLQHDLADDLLLPPNVNAAGDCPGASVKLNRRSLGGLAFDIQFAEGESAAAATTGASEAASPGRNSGKPRGPPAVLATSDNSQQLTSEEIAERLAAAELRREQQLAQRLGKVEVKVSEAKARRKRLEEERSEQSQKVVEETLKAAEERRLGIMEEVKQRARGQSANAKERSEAVREQQEAARQLLEAGLEKDIRDKEARRKEQLDRIVQGAQQHLAKVEGVRSQRQGGDDAPQAQPDE